MALLYFLFFNDPTLLIYDIYVGYPHYQCDDSGVTVL